MRTPLAVVFGALLIGVSIIGAQFIGGRYEIASGSDTVVWRVNVRTGIVDLCSFAESTDPFAKYDSSKPPSVDVKTYDLTCRRSVTRP
jgi:hypothetical protein